MVAHSDKTGRERLKAMKPELEVLSADTDRRLAEILNDSQMEQYRRIKKERRKQARERRYKRQR